MERRGIEVYEFNAYDVLQIERYGKWMDFSTLRTASEAQRAVNIVASGRWNGEAYTFRIRRGFDNGIVWEVAQQDKMQHNEESRPSWFVCDSCKEPHTKDRPLIRVMVKENHRAHWQIHETCQPILQASLLDGVELVRS